MNFKGLHAATGEFQRVLGTLTSEIRKADSYLNSLPSCDGDLQGILLEWLAAEDDAHDHHTKFQEFKTLEYDAQPEHVREDWSRICTRRWKANEAVTNYAVALRCKLADKPE